MNLITALATLYLVWGSTYLAIRFAVASWPPFFMGGSRFLSAGLLLYGFLKLRGVASPTRQQLKSAFVVGAFLLLAGNGAVVWAEQFVPSGLTALLVSCVPIWLVLFSWMLGRTSRPSLLVVVGIMLGFLGVFFLVHPGGEVLGSGRQFYMGAAALVFASVMWALGSLYSKVADLPSSPWMSTAIQMAAGGLLMLAASATTGEFQSIHLTMFVMKPTVAWIYLVLIGSLVGYSAYVWVLKHAPVALAGTYAYVNPVVALILGWWLAGEKLSTSMMIGAGFVVVGVGLISWDSARASRTVSQENP